MALPPHLALWQAIRHLFPAHAMADQIDFGGIVVSWTLPGDRPGNSRFAAPIMIRIAGAAQ